MRIRAVLVDLDDTLYPQAEFLDAAWRAVAECGRRFGLEPERLLAALRTEAAAGSDRGGIIDRALAVISAPPCDVSQLLAAFRTACPAKLTPYPGVPQALNELRSRVSVAVVTDGEIQGQQRKLAALGLTGVFDAEVFSDRWGKSYRKPHPRPFLTALHQLGVSPGQAVVIGDRPDKDVAGAARVLLRAIRVTTGEYSQRPDHPATWLRADSFVDAVAALRPHLVKT
jgi:putative hydrolase of the HAD superfamily